MVNWKGLAIFIILLCMMIISVTCVISESFTTKSTKSISKTKKLAKKDECMNIIDNILEEKDTGEEKQIASSESEVDSTFVLKDSVRRDSKVASTLNYTYLDERCEKLLKPIPPPFPEETMIRTEPLTPIVSQETANQSELQNSLVSQEVSESNMNLKQENMPKTTSIDIRKEKTQKESEPFYSEMFDDKELKPKPNVNSPYGFVFFPNKYWNQWHQKPPVCVPTNKCKVLPTYTQGTPVDVLDYTQIGSMLPKGQYYEEFEERK